MANLVSWPDLNEGNDENVLVAVTTNRPTDGTPLDLTGAVVECFLKPSAATADADGSVWKGSTATGEITVTDAPAGEVEIEIPGTAVQQAKGFMRVDVIADGKRKTGPYGPVVVTDL